MFSKIFKNKIKSLWDSIGRGRSLRYKGTFNFDSGYTVYIDTYVIIPKVFSDDLTAVRSIISNQIKTEILAHKSIIDEMQRFNSEIKFHIIELLSNSLDNFKDDIWFNVNKLEIKTKSTKRDDKIDKILN